MKKVVGILATIVVCLRAYAVFGMDQALVPAGGGGRRPNIGGVVAALAMANIQFGQIPQAQPIFAHSPAHADASISTETEGSVRLSKNAMGSNGRGANDWASPRAW